MKNLIMLALAGGLATAPLAMAKGTAEDVERVLQAGTQYGISQFHSIEFDDDGWERIEVEGWLTEGGYVELDMNDDGTIGRERRREQSGEPAGLSADELRDYLQAARGEGLVLIEEIDVDARGKIEFSGENEAGQELEVDFRRGDLTPVKVELDD